MNSPAGSNSPKSSNRSSRWIEDRIARVSAFVSWIWLALILLIVLTVVLRFVFDTGRIEFEELEWHLYAAGFLIGIVTCASQDRHVRVDVFREKMSTRTLAWIDLYGIFLFQIPFIALVLSSALPFVADSFATGEESAAAGGLPYRWLLKSLVPISFIMLGLATLARLLRVIHALFGEQPATGPGESA